eukprot:SAG22_NODE_717_length_7707_cov_3.098186_3_plen_93_part_00
MLLFDGTLLTRKYHPQAAGEVVVAIGEPADCMYIVHHGTAAAEIGGAVVASYEAGDFFGELGTWSRTATRDLCPFVCHLKASLPASWTTKGY